MENQHFGLPFPLCGFGMGFACGLPFFMAHDLGLCVKWLNCNTVGIVLTRQNVNYVFSTMQSNINYNTMVISTDEVMYETDGYKD